MNVKKSTLKSTDICIQYNLVNGIPFPYLQEHSTERAKVEEDLRSQVVTLETAKAVLEERVAGLDQAVNTMQTHMKATEDSLNKQVCSLGS